MRSVIGRPMYWLPIVVMILISANAILLRPYLGVRNAAEAIVKPLAMGSATAMPTETAVPVSAPYDAVLRDAKRQLDLAAIRDALEAHRAGYGSYPSTGGEAETFCERAADAGCVLLTASPDLSTEDSVAFSYWYVSDGRTFTVFAPAETVAAGCDARRLPSWLAGGIFYCVGSKGVGE